MSESVGARRPYGTEAPRWRGKLLRKRLGVLAPAVFALQFPDCPMPPIGFELADDERLFAVYGTLRQGDDNDITLLQPAPRRLGTAWVCGVMHDLGAYPGVLLLPQRDTEPRRVLCEVYAVSAALERKLDAIESEYPAQPDEYAKRLITVPVHAHGQVHEVQVHIYEINPRDARDKPVIASGDWVKDRRRNGAPEPDRS